MEADVIIVFKEHQGISVLVCQAFSYFLLYGMTFSFESQGNGHWICMWLDVKGEVLGKHMNCVKCERTRTLNAI
jgi:hypothetical protein